MNLLGWIYLVLTVGGVLAAINEIDKPREPRTRGDVMSLIIFSGLSFWALYLWGLKT